MLLSDLGLASPWAAYAAAACFLSPRRPRGEPRGFEPLPPLPEEVEIVAFRIYQEIVTNVLRHAAAETVAMKLGVRDGHLVLAVEDDGRGIPEGRPPGAGIVGMRERADLVSGSLTVDSEEGMGTRVLLEVPLGEPRPRVTGSPAASLSAAAVAREGA